jgi:hypothetical protein
VVVLELEASDDSENQGLDLSPERSTVGFPRSFVGNLFADNGRLADPCGHLCPFATGPPSIS